MKNGNEVKNEYAALEFDRERLMAAAENEMSGVFCAYLIVEFISFVAGIILIQVVSQLFALNISLADSFLMSFSGTFVIFFVIPICVLFVVYLMMQLRR